MIRSKVQHTSAVAHSTVDEYMQETVQTSTHLHEAYGIKTGRKLDPELARTDMHY